MFDTIVVGTDGSTHAQAAVRAAAQLAGNRAVVHVVTAFHPLSAAEMSRVAASLPDELRSLVGADMAAESALADARRELGRAGITAEYHELDREPTAAVLDVAERAGADLVVVGSRGLGATGRLLHGSVSTKVIHHAPCSVLVVRDDAGEAR